MGNIWANKKQIQSISVLLIILSLVLAACDQDDDPEKKKSFTVGTVMSHPAANESFTSFKEEMTAREYIEGENVTYIEALSLDDLDKQFKVSELDLLYLTSGTFGDEVSGFAQAQALTAGKVPIVVVSASGDPVASGDAESLQLPGKNLTGVLLSSVDVKRFDLFEQMLPESAGNVAVIYNPDNAEVAEQLDQIQAIAEKSGLSLVLLPTLPYAPETTEEAFQTIPPDVGGVFLLKIWGTIPQWSQWAYDHKVPSSSDGYVNLAVPQAMMVYGPSFKDMAREAGRMAAYILDGTEPGHVPMEYAESMLIIDMAVVESIGLELSSNIVRQAREIRRSDLTVYATPAPSTQAVVQTAGAGACAAKTTTMGGVNTICATAPCSDLQDGPGISYSEKSEVASCSSENLVGICAASAFDMYYYDGEAAILQIGCGFMKGVWSAAES